MFPNNGLLAAYTKAGQQYAGTPVLSRPVQQRGAACRATGTQMNLFSRLFRVARSYANSIGVAQCSCAGLTHVVWACISQLQNRL